LEGWDGEAGVGGGVGSISPRKFIKGMHECYVLYASSQIYLAPGIPLPWDSNLFTQMKA